MDPTTRASDKEAGQGPSTADLECRVDGGDFSGATNSLHSRYRAAEERMA